MPYFGSGYVSVIKDLLQKLAKHNTTFAYFVCLMLSDILIHQSPSPITAKQMIITHKNITKMHKHKKY